MARIPTAGTISHGTLRPQDLIPRFIDALVEFGDPDDVMLPLLIDEARSLLKRLGDDADADNQATEIEGVIDDLFDALDDIAARHEMYFGSTEADGSDYGFWPLPKSDENVN